MSPRFLRAVSARLVRATGLRPAGSRPGRAVVAGLLPVLAAGAILSGCGHRVTPTDAFRDPESIPRPEDVQAVSFRDRVEVTWFTEPDIFAFVDGWHVYRATGEALPDPKDYRRINPELVQRNDYRDDDVVDGTRYWYVVTSLSPAGIESRPTDAASVRVDATPPDAPEGLRASVRFNAALNRWEVEVAWDEVAAADLDHYNLYREPGIPNLPVVQDLIEPRWVDDTVEADGTYAYWVTAVDGNINESAAGDTVEVTIPGPPRAVESPA